MVDREFYENLKKVLESDSFNEVLLSCGDGERRRLFLVKAIYFLISTREFSSFDKFLSCYYKDFFPHKYIKENTNLSDKAIENMIYDNFIKNGYLFHVTPQYNVDEILDCGLMSLNDKFKCDLYKKCNELNLMYSQIRDRNFDSIDLMNVPYLINIPGGDEYAWDRFNTIYLSSNLDYILEIYGESSELLGFFLNDLSCAFKNYEDLRFLPKKDMKTKIIQIIRDSQFKVYDEEISKIMEFVDIVYENKKDNKRASKSILLVPTKTIVSNFSYFDNMYKTNSLNLSVEIIHDYRYGEVGSSQRIPAENIIAINCNEDKSLSLKIKR